MPITLFQATIPVGENIDAPITDIGEYASGIVTFLLMIGALATFVYLSWGGLNWIMAGGDPDKVSQARERITQALIGLAILAASWAIFTLIDSFLGLGVAIN
jgi:hypothetical protein